ncbi:hypothetical protein, partial [Agrobacterium sp. NPDC089420]|uniref:hypothetical protein n=1 Tax=Agrobacterium sp. NPDC089420 TaxID=3363918 RepID=UPI00384C2C6A
WLPHVRGRIYHRPLDCLHEQMLDADPAAEIGAIIQAETLRELLVLRVPDYPMVAEPERLPSAG